MAAGPHAEWVRARALHHLSEGGREGGAKRKERKPGPTLISWSFILVSCSVMSDSVAPWTVARQSPLSMEFSRQEYWSRLPLPYPGDLPDPGIKPRSRALQVDSFLSEPPGKPFILKPADIRHETSRSSFLKLM